MFICFCSSCMSTVYIYLPRGGNKDIHSFMYSKTIKDDYFTCVYIMHGFNLLYSRCIERRAHM